MDLEKERTLEKLKCENSFVYFLKYCKLVEAPTRGNLGGIIPFILWPHLKKAINALLGENLIAWLKSRQIGASWIVAAYCLWYTMFKVGSLILLFSKGEDEAIELLNKCRRIYTYLPPFLKEKLGADSATMITFPLKQSSIQAKAATESGGVSFTASVIVCDEWILHPYASRNFLQAKPCIDQGGQFIGIFTIDKTRMNEIAVQTFVDAMGGRNNFKWLFDPFDVRPGRDEQWYEDTKNSIPESELMGITSELYMLSNYPRSVDEALRTIGTAAAFDHSSLQSIQDNARQVLSQEWYGNNAEADRGIVKIYRPFVMGNAYVASADVAHGVGRDFTAFGIMDVKSGEIVCDILRNDISPADIAYPIRSALKYYHDPKFFPEDNDRGRVLIEKLIDLGFKNWGYYGKKGSNTKDKIGWHTGRNRNELITGLVSPVNNMQIQVNSDQGIEQMRDLIRNIDKEGRIEAARGKNDDYPIMLAILWANRKEVSIEEWEPYTMQTLHFRGDKEWPNNRVSLNTVI